MASPKNRFYITANAVTVEVFPNNFAKTKYVTEQQEGQIFYRRKLSGKLIFINSGDDVTDFTTLFNIEIGADTVFDGATGCSELTFEIQKFCSGEYSTDWTGRFSTGVGKFDYDQCTFEVEMEVVDRYTCILDNLKSEINVLDQPEIHRYIVKSNIGTIHELVQTKTTTYEGCSPPVIDVEKVCKIDGVVVDCATVNFSEWCHVGHTSSTHATPDPCGRIDIDRDRYTREEVTVACVAGACVPPAFGTWTLLTDNSPVDCTYWRCNPGAVYFDRAMRLDEIIEFFLSQTPCDLEYSSIFFNRNPDTSDPFYAFTSGGTENYVTADFSWTNNLMLLQKSDAIRPTSTDPATVGLTTLEKILIDLRIMFAGNVYWDVTEDGRFILEHILYFHNDANTSDIRARDTLRNRSKNKYEHTRAEIPRTETFSFMEGEYLGKGDFATNAIKYSDICSSTNDLAMSCGDVTTNLEFIRQYPDQISDDGFAMISTYLEPSDGFYYINSEVGLLSGFIRLNGHLSWANLLYNYGRYDRFLKEGEMNGNAETFFTFKPNIKQVPLMLEQCCDSDEFIPENQFLTEIGQDVLGGVNGFVESAEQNNGTDLLSLTLKYPL